MQMIWGDHSESFSGLNTSSNFFNTCFLTNVSMFSGELHSNTICCFSFLLIYSRLMMIEVQTSLGIFEGKAGQIFLSYDQASLDQRIYFKGGNLIAWSIAHGGPCIKALDPSLFQLMCSQEPPLEQFDWNVLPDPDVQNKVKRVLNNYHNIYWDFKP